MKLEEFLAANGLNLDPFAFTNAEEEDLLTEYFVPPPYFASVRGNASQPKSTIVFAPRGGGKTAQRRVLEEDSRSPDSAFLCVLYDRFPETGSRTVNQHIDQISLRVVLGILITLENDNLTGLALQKPDRDFLLGEASLLDNIDSETFAALISSLKSDTRKMGDWARDHSGPIKGVVAGLLAKRGIDLDPTIPWGPQMTKARETPPLSRLERLIKLCQTLGFQSVYVLIDRLDETAKTNTDPKKAIDLVLDLLLDLKVMELPGLAIKVFVWHLSQDYYHEKGGRQDRVKEFTLDWRLEALGEMMTRRLGAYSSQRINSLNDLTMDDLDFDFHKLATYLAHGSPRDMIRLGGHIRDEHLYRADADGRFTEADIWAGVERFSAEITDERAKKFMPDLLRLDAYRFTMNRVANDYLKIKRQAVNAKVVEWRKTAMIEKIAEIQDARRRPQHLYGVCDPRLAIALRPSLAPRDVLEFYAFECPACAKVNLSDELRFICNGCQRDLESNTVPTLMYLCR